MLSQNINRIRNLKKINTNKNSKTKCTYTGCPRFDGRIIFFLFGLTFQGKFNCQLGFVHLTLFEVLSYDCFFGKILNFLFLLIIFENIRKLQRNVL